MKSQVVGVVQNHSRPEFINRLDEIVVFRPLVKAQIRAIARIQLQGWNKRLAECELTLDISDKALDLLANTGFDPVYGAPAQARHPATTGKPAGQKLLGDERVRTR